MNRLATESSPYLRQHADNPVDWYPWGPEAFERARAEDKPLLISVGYSACHWCHVMERESFSDPAVAEVMNRHFVNVKVDREERPDVDSFTMSACQMFTGGGGWPTTVFLTPDGRPFWAGTYFPPVRRGGMPAFPEVLDAVARAWDERRGEISEIARRVTSAIAELGSIGRVSKLPPPAEARSNLLASLSRRFDTRWGGFSTAPKFPQAPLLDFLERLSRRGGPEACSAADMLEHTLRMMATGGIFDHVGGGYHRYSTDRRWIVPHFEKMLTDQAQAVSLHLRRWQSTGDDTHLWVCEAIVGYVLRDMVVADGGIASSQDADSEGVEGLYYTWTPREVAQAVSGEFDHREVCAYWGIEEPGHLDGRSVLHRADRSFGPLPTDMAAALQRLRVARSSRTPPARDDKVVLEWNARWVGALAEAALVTGRDDWRRGAESTARFLRRRLWDAQVGWLRCWHPAGGNAPRAFAVDHAAVADAFCRMYELTGEGEWLEHASETASTMLARFRRSDGGLAQTDPRPGEPQLDVADFQDSAAPSTYSTATLALTRLWGLTGEERFRDAAEEILHCLGRVIEKIPETSPQALLALEMLEGDLRQVVIVGDRPDLLRTAARALDQWTVIAWGDRLDSPLWRGRADGHAHVCRNFVCTTPLSAPEELAEALQSGV
ncbi:MAG: thioredoxin domain-containing protein [Acidimicrobiales bacterium]|nr:MAG: thioredoxin domain-containing protein [Acidimicrobiales bacterium]